MTSIDIHSLQDHRTSWNAPRAYDGSKSPRSVDDSRSVFHVWQKPDTGFHELKSRLDDQIGCASSSLDSALDNTETIVFDDHSDDDDDVIMQIDENEGLLSLNDFYESISNDVGRPQELLADAMLTNISATDDDTNSFFSCESSDITHNRDGTSFYHSQQQKQQQLQQHFHESLRKLNHSMKKSHETRRSLYAKTPKLKDYQRSSTVRNVLQHIDYSSRQIDSYYHHSALTPTPTPTPTSSPSTTRMMMSTFS